MVEYLVHGIRLAIDSTWPRFSEYIALNLSAFSPRRQVSDELRVQVSMRRKPWFPPPQQEGVTRTGEQRWGDTVFSNGAGVRLHEGNLDVGFEVGPPARVWASYLLGRPHRVLSAIREVPPWEVIQKVARQAVYLPLFHLLERSGTIALHAAAVAGRNGAVVLLGLNGSGKSTLCWSLLDRLGYMGDNYVLWTGNEVLGFPESPCIPLAQAPKSGSRRLTIWGKRIVPVEASRVLLSAKPCGLVFLTLGRQTAMAALGEKEAARRLEIVQDMTAEFSRYGYLGPLSTPRTPWARSLASSVPAYALTLGDISTARAMIMELAEGTSASLPSPSA